MGIGPELLEPYGAHVAKVSLDAIGALAERPRARYVVVTAVTPTPLGEGKTTTTVGLGQALACIGRQATVAIRQASMGPTFGIKGGAAGGGYSQVVPFENLNLHLTGDLHAVTAANNLLAAMVDNHLYNQNALGIDPHGITWKRVLDVNDRSLRNIVSGLGAKQDGIPRETGFDITAASEVMAVLALARDLRDLRDRMGRIVVGYTAAGEPVTAEELRAAGAMTVIMRDAIKPNLLQTLENTPVLVHAGPFGNIAHGNSSVVADLIGIHAGEYLVTEAGLRGRHGGGALLQHQVPHLGAGARRGGRGDDGAGDEAALGPAPRRGRPPAAARDARREPGRGASSARPTSWPIWPSSGATASRPSSPSTRSKATSRPSTPPSARSPSPWACVPRSAPTSRRAARVRSSWRRRWSRPPRSQAGSTCCTRRKRRCGRRSKPSPPRSTGRTASTTSRWRHASSTPTSGPVSARCPSASPRPTSPSRRIPRCLGAPRGWRLPVREARANVGAGFVYLVSGDMRTMPGLSHSPAAERIDIDDDGNVVGLY